MTTSQDIRPESPYPYPQIQERARAYPRLPPTTPFLGNARRKTFFGGGRPIALGHIVPLAVLTCRIQAQLCDSFQREDVLIFTSYFFLEKALTIKVGVEEGALNPQVPLCNV